MARFAIHSTNTGTSAARPVLGVIDVPDEPADTFAARVAAQPLNANEALIALQEAASLTDLNSETDTNEFTVDTTATPPVALTAVSVARFSLQQRQAEYRRKRDLLIAEALPFAQFGREFASDSTIEQWLTYINSLRNLADAPANPEGVSFPSIPSDTESGGVSVWARLWRRGNTIGNVSKLLGVPTGQLFEYETTANGYYRKGADGLMLCTHRLRLEYSSSVQLAGTWTFPAAFGNAAIDRRSVHVMLSNRDNSNTNYTGTGSNLTMAELAQLQPITNTQGQSTNVSILLRAPTSILTADHFAWVELFAMARWDN